MDHIHNANQIMAPFMPHGHCYYWNPTLVSIHAISDTITAISFYAVAAIISYFFYKRKDIKFKPFFYMFGVIIFVACATTHAMNVWTIWNPDYWVQGYIMMFTAIVSVITVYLFFPLIPQALKVPTPGQLQIEIEERLKAESSLKLLNEELQKAHEDLRKANENLELKIQLRTKELQRANEELERFAYITSHDLSEPLRSISSYAQLLKRRYGDKLDERANEYIDITVKGAQRMRNLIDDILSFSKYSLSPKNLNIQNTNEILKNVLSNIELSIKENNVNITYEDLPYLRLEESHIIRVFQNLLSNSIKYGAKNISINYKDQVNNYLFCIKDDGIGIDPKYKDKIFIIFQRLHNNEDYEGTGMGLAICKKIIENSGGKIWVESELGQGSSFLFTIPK